MEMRLESVPQPRRQEGNEAEFIAGYDFESFMHLQMRVLEAFFSTEDSDHEIYFNDTNDTPEKWLGNSKNADALRFVVTTYLEGGGNPEHLDVVVESLKERLQSMLEFH